MRLPVVGADALKSGDRQLVRDAVGTALRDQQQLGVTPVAIREAFEAVHTGSLEQQVSKPSEVFLTALGVTPLVSEVFTDTEPVAREAKARGHAVGPSRTLHLGYDFLSKRCQDRALAELEDEDPFCAVVAFPCGPFSSLMFLNWGPWMEQIRRNGSKLVDFAVKVAYSQLSRGRRFIIENPLAPMAWRIVRKLRQLMWDKRVHWAIFDQCMMGNVSVDGMPQRKATMVITDLWEVARRLDGVRCDRSHRHAIVIGGSKVTRLAGHYPQPMVDRIVDGLESQWRKEMKKVSSEIYAASSGCEALANDDDFLDADDDIAPEDMPAFDGVDVDQEDADEEQGPEDLRKPVDKQLLASLMRLHNNTGHRPMAQLARALMIAGAPAHVVAAARRLRCDICCEAQKTKTHRPATLPKARHIGDVVHADLIKLNDERSYVYWALNVVDAASGYQVVSLLDDKSSKAVIENFEKTWVCWARSPGTLCVGMGPEFTSLEFGQWCEFHGIALHHIPVEAPWQNGVAERAGGAFKVVLSAVTKEHAVVDKTGMLMALSAAGDAVNDNINESGFSASQWMLGRAKKLPGDLLAAPPSQYLAQHSAIANTPAFTRRIAMMETAKRALVRLSFSRRLRRAELARSRTVPIGQELAVGDLAYFYRQTMHNPRGSGRPGKLLLRQWHGPALVLGKEGRSAVYLGYRGNCTKCAPEAVRPASSLEQLAAESWSEALQDVLMLAQPPRPPPDVPAEPAPEAPLPAPLAPAAPAAPALPEQAPPEVPAPDLLPAVPEEPVPVEGDPAPADAEEQVQIDDDDLPLTQYPMGSRARPPLFRFRARDAASGWASDLPPQAQALRQRLLTSVRRSSSAAGERGRDGDALPTPVFGAGLPARLPEGAAPEAADAQPAQLPSRRAAPAADLPNVVGEPSAKRLRAGQVGDLDPDEHELSAAEAFTTKTAAENEHPIVGLYRDLLVGDTADTVPKEHGTWKGNWPLPSRTQFSKAKGNDFEAYLVAKSARKEIAWSTLPPSRREKYQAAADKQWSQWLDNHAVHVYSEAESAKLLKELREQNKEDLVLRPRFVLTDKNDGQRTADNPLPEEPSARLVVPGYQDKANIENTLRRDAPTGSRNAQHLLFTLAGANPDWRLASADVRAAFLKGDPYISRELYLMAPSESRGPRVKMTPRQIAKVLKGVFGLADAPREWYLRLARCLKENGWVCLQTDQACWVRRDSRGKVLGIIVGHVDDLLFAGNKEAYNSLVKIGEELGFGKVDIDDFVWCGKRIRRAEDGTVRVSMIEYHQNLNPARVPRERRTDPDARLTAFEEKQLRAIGGSLMWLVSQLRFDLAFRVSSLMGETKRPTVATLLRANALVVDAKGDDKFELIFRKVDWDGGGIIVVGDAALGNVAESGSADVPTEEKVHSQAAYLVGYADPSLLSGGTGSFTVLDSRSHRLQRVGRSSYSVETMGLEEAVDAAQLLRGMVAEIKGAPVTGRHALESIDKVPCTAVVDAKDTHDKCVSDTSSFGSQKSLAFTIAWLRQQFRRPGMSLRWTATENMLVDSLTKDMSTQHFRDVLQRGVWSITYNQNFVKEKVKAKRPVPVPEGLVLPGEPVAADSGILRHLERLRRKPGWHVEGEVRVQVARNAHSFRTPEPRYAMSEFPRRSSYALYRLAGGGEHWRRLEDAVIYSEEVNQHAMLERPCAMLVTIFSPGEFAVDESK